MFKEFIPQLLMIISAAAVLFLLGRKVSGSIKKLDKKEIESAPRPLEELSPEKMKERLFKKLEKMLRRIKIIFIQIDAKIVEMIKRLRRGREEKYSDEEENRSGEVLAEKNEKKQSIMEKVSKIKKKLASSKNVVKIDALKKPKLPDPLKPQIPSPESINIEEAKRVMFERQEKALIRRISLNPGDDEAYVELGKLYRDSKNLKDARASFKQALKLNKGNMAAKKFLKEIGG